MNNLKIDLESSWKQALSTELRKDYFLNILSFLDKQETEGHTIYPLKSLIFNAFDLCPFDKVKVVIIGQDPYHGDGQAMGLSFSVPAGMKVPPSLKNIYKELNTDLGIDIPDHGDLKIWATRGILLLNAILTVEQKKPGSHKKIGWQKFTDHVIKLLSEKRENLVFLLWGNFAKGKKKLIDPSKHLILEAPHPSPLARGGFFGSKHFSKTNDYLTAHNIKIIDWQL